MIIYGDRKSGNCYKLQLLCANLNIEHQWIEVDILNKETQSSDFLAKNPNGKIPVLELDSGEFLTESNAILNYLAQNSPLLANDLYHQAKILQWQFFEQYSHEPFIAVARFIEKYLGLPAERLEEYKQKQQGAYKALDVMENHLSTNSFFVSNQYSIADISLYAYTHVADEGGISLVNYPNINAWLVRVEQQPGYCKIAQ
ncbi:glutathione S-transferase family protein [Thalassomonas sp. M1454]|uniref:glutathione S-transferase family protein n=1 Tax=Thalassomonas sp. M1454 TaxID=2594477 RepID=UPI00117D81A1|nr:glutathione S-transferase family protein [Thalassomonas sp. M1454]TRX55703.1 glutathione S-transferase family protein [Thalassomonas sp. M1454]